MGGKRYGQACGNQRAPFINLQGRLEDDLVEFLTKATMQQLTGQLGDAELRKSNQRHVAEWHAVASHAHAALHIFVPRGGGPGFSSAPVVAPALMAFAEAFRHKNACAFFTIEERLNILDSKVAKTCASAFREGRHFGVWEVQRFYGTHKRECGWHIDGATSLMHLAVTLGGQRDLKVEYACGSKPKDPTKKETATMTRGDVYLSSPFLFHHGVQFKESSRFEDASLSIQMRIGFTSKSESQWINHMRNGEMLAVANVIADVLEAAPVEMPSLDEVKLELQRLWPMTGGKKRTREGGESPRRKKTNV